MSTPQQRRLVELQLRVFRENYESHKDPFLPWLAYSWARAQQLPVPAWVHVYLESAARKLEALYDREISKRFIRRGRRRLPLLQGTALFASIAGALDMKTRGRGTIFSRRATWVRDQYLAADVNRRFAQDGKQYLAIENVAKARRLSRATVERAYTTAKARKSRKTVSTS
jgi:hypothetical protein